MANHSCPWYNYYISKGFRMSPHSILSTQFTKISLPQIILNNVLNDIMCERMVTNQIKFYTLWPMPGT